MALAPSASAIPGSTSNESLPAYSPFNPPDPWRDPSLPPPAPPAAAPTRPPPPPPAPARPPPPPPVPDTRINYNVYPSGDRSNASLPNMGTLNTDTYMPGRTLSDDEIPMNPSPASPPPGAGPYDPVPAAPAPPASAWTSSGGGSAGSMANVYEPVGSAGSSAYLAANGAQQAGGNAYGRPYWDAPSATSNVYTPVTPASSPPMPPPTSLATTNNPARPANAPAAKPPRKRSEDPRPWGNPYFWIILFVLLPSAALSGVAWILWNTWTLEFPDAVTLALPLRVLSYLAFISLGLSFTFLLLSIVGDQCCTAPDPSSTSDRRIRKQPPVWLVDLRLALSVLVACAFLGTLVSYSVALSPNVSFLNSACAVPGVFCGQARAALGLASAAGFGWLLLAVWSGVSRKKAVWARAMKQAARV